MDEWAKPLKPDGYQEYMGYIEKMGAGVTNLKTGERVTGEGFCGHGVTAVEERTCL